MRTVRHLLIVEDSASLASTLRAALADRVERISHAGTLAAARERLESEPPDAVILDYSLPDGEAEELLPLLRTVEPLPHLIAISGTAKPEQGFRLAQHGVRAFLAKPLDLARLEEVWAETLARPPDLTPALRASLGVAPLHAVEEVVRSTLVDEAMARSG